ncbi:MAG: hypothetical protein BGO14_00770 [Chlamydiales bacterium 38-26]|nr:hypothetical protein [Chlamydiales bacterium]OJV07255.1 MAG: hypothetical protein BGO14_00770 [Chlamydiales bacterium 38-26]
MSFPPKLVPTGRVFKEYEIVENEPIVRPPKPRPSPEPIKITNTQQALCCCGIIAVVALGALGIANFVTYKQVPNQYNFVAGIVFCSLSGITLIALTIIGIKSCIKENPSIPPSEPSPSEPSDLLFRV